MNPEEAMQEVRRICADPKYRAVVIGNSKALEAVHEQGNSLNRATTKPLFDDLHAAGVEIELLGELTKWDPDDMPYVKAVPILLKHLRKDYPGNIKETMLQLLKVPQAEVGVSLMIEEYKKAPKDEDQPGWHSGGLPGFLNGDVKYNLAETIVFLGKRSHLQEILGLAADPVHGGSRLAFLIGLRRSKKPEVRQLFVNLANDPDLSIQIAAWFEIDNKRLKRDAKTEISQN